MKDAMQLLEAIGQIQDGYILDAHSDIPKAALPRKRLLLIAAVAAILLLLAGCATYAWHWYTVYFSMQRTEPLSDSQVSYINENAQSLDESQTYEGYTIELKSALAESREAFVTLRLTAPDDVALMNRKEGDRLHFGSVYAVPEGSDQLVGMSCHIVEDGDGRDQTANLVLSIGPTDVSGAEISIGGGQVWHIVLRDLVVECWDREYEQELLRTKYAGVTDYMFTDEEAARAHSQELLVSGKWEFDVEFPSADEDILEFLTEPISTKAVITRKDRSHPLFYDTKDFVEDITVTSVSLRVFSAIVTFEKPETLEGSDFPDFFCAWMDMGDTYNPLTRLVCQDENFFVVLKDGTRIDFWQGEGAVDAAYLKTDSPIVLKNVDYLQLSDGTKLYPVSNAVE